jgi:GGDEF domain-containing protein
MSSTRSVDSQRLDPSTGFGDRERLVADLAAALEPGSPRAVLAVFDLGGAAEYRREFGERAGEVLIAHCAEGFAREMSRDGLCYRPRRDEFCALIAKPIEEAMTLLVAAEHALRMIDPLLIATCFGATVLPDEAADPVELLMLADERLYLRLTSREPRERRREVRPD